MEKTAGYHVNAKDDCDSPPTQDHSSIGLRHLRVAAYCQVSTELEEQTSSIELQVRHYSQLTADFSKSR